MQPTRPAVPVAHLLESSSNAISSGWHQVTCASAAKASLGSILISRDDECGCSTLGHSSEIAWQFEGCVRATRTSCSPRISRRSGSLSMVLSYLRCLAAPARTMDHSG